MASKVRIYYNPKCSKCRSTLEILDNNGVEAEVLRYLESPPTIEELNHVLDLLGLEPRQLMRKHEPPYQALELDNTELSRSALIQAMIDNPILIERPIIIKDNKAVIGRPPEKVLELF